jgi:hypothetical protein
MQLANAVMAIVSRMGEELVKISKKQRDISNRQQIKGMQVANSIMAFVSRKGEELVKI